MKDFQATAPGRLRSVSVGSKLLYTAFALATLIGLLVSWRLYGAGVGDAGAAAYYAGAAVTAAPKAAPPPSGSGPAIELSDDDAKPRVLVEQVSERKLLEVTHFHLFSIPIYVLVLAHLWLLTKLPVKVQNAGVVLAIVTSGLHVGAPWIVRGHAGLAALMPLSGAAMLLVLGGMALVSTIDMWLPQPSMADQLAEMRRQRGQAGAKGPGEPREPGGKA